MPVLGIERMLSDLAASVLCHLVYLRLQFFSFLFHYAPSFLVGFKNFIKSLPGKCLCSSRVQRLREN